MSGGSNTKFLWRASLIPHGRHDRGGSRQHDGQNVLILEDPGGEPLMNFLDSRSS